MPQNRYSSRDVFDVDLLDPRALDTPDGLRTAIRAIEAVCNRGGSEIAEMVATLNSRTYVLEYIISGTLRNPQVPCVSPALIASPSSARGEGVREALEVDSYRVSHIQSARHDGYHEYPSPPEILFFVAIRGVSIPCRCTSQPSCIPEKGGTLARCSKGT